MLQRWTVRKRLEHLAKTWLRCANGQGISAIPPASYARRFTERVIYDVFDAPLDRDDLRDDTTHLP